MSDLVRSAAPVVLVGGGPVDPEQLRSLLTLGGPVVAADGGAAAVLDAGRVPDLVIGDFDSLGPEMRAVLPEERLHHIAEQDSTDFHKCLARIDAPEILALGFSGGRMDHFLAVVNVLVRLPQRRCIVLGDRDLCLLAPPRLTLDIPAGTDVSLYPMGRVAAESSGLHWPIKGLDFAPDGQSGTSNRATGPVELVVHAPKLLLMLPLSALEALRQGLREAPVWV